VTQLKSSATVRPKAIPARHPPKRNQPSGGGVERRRVTASVSVLVSIGSEDRASVRIDPPFTCGRLNCRRRVTRPVADTPESRK
jgi:hypothetical protein